MDIPPEKEFYKKGFSRNYGLISPAEQRKLKKSRVAIAGAGGAGGIYVISFVRLGVGNLTLADLDAFVLENLNRQAGADTRSFGKGKVATMERKAKEINPYVSVQAFRNGINEKNIDAFLEGADVVIDALDFFAIDARMLLYQKARERGLSIVASAPTGFGATSYVFSPNGMTFEEYFDIRKEMDFNEKIVRFGLGTVPAMLQRSYFRPDLLNLNTHSAPSSGMATFLCANMVTCEAMKIILGRGEVDVIPVSAQFDPYIKVYKRTRLWWGNRSLLQRLKIWYVRRMLKKAGKA